MNETNNGNIISSISARDIDKADVIKASHEKLVRNADTDIYTDQYSDIYSHRKDLADLAEDSLNVVAKPVIKAKFGQNAGIYDSVAVVQRRIADRLVEYALEHTIQHTIQNVEENTKASRLDELTESTVDRTQTTAQITDNALNELHTTFSVLDAGAGTGYVGEAFAKRFQALKMEISQKISQMEASSQSVVDLEDASALPSLHLTALDLSAEMLEVAKARNVYQAYTKGDIEQLPFVDHQFDLVLSSLAIQWCHSLDNAIAELVRVSKAQQNSMSKNTAKNVLIATIVEGTLRELSDAFRQIDNDSHILEFVTKAQLEETIKKYQGKIHFYEEVVTFPNLKALFQSLKNIGATAIPNRRKGLLGRESYRRLEQYFQDLGAYQLTYEVAIIEI